MPIPLPVPDVVFNPNRRLCLTTLAALLSGCGGGGSQGDATGPTMTAAGMAPDAAATIYSASA